MEIDEVMTIVEAVEKWHIPANTLKCACRGQKVYPPRFTKEETRQSGKIWLVTRAGMEKVYGKKGNDSIFPSII